MLFWFSVSHWVNFLDSSSTFQRFIFILADFPSCHKMEPAAFRATCFHLQNQRRKKEPNHQTWSWASLQLNKFLENITTLEPSTVTSRMLWADWLRLGSLVIFSLWPYSLFLTPWRPITHLQVPVAFVSQGSDAVEYSSSRAARPFVAPNFKDTGQLQFSDSHKPEVFSLHLT